MDAVEISETAQKGHIGRIVVGSILGGLIGPASVGTSSFRFF